MMDIKINSNVIFMPGSAANIEQAQNTQLGKSMDAAVCFVYIIAE
jgi:hypothetical protein